jgi:hypothetical protein
VESISRRKFLRQAGTGVAAIGAFSAVGGLKLPREVTRPDSSPVDLTRVEPHDGPLVVEIPDPRRDEVHLLFGTSEIVRHDGSLVARLVRASR